MTLTHEPMQLRQESPDLSPPPPTIAEVPPVRGQGRGWRVAAILVVVLILAIVGVLVSMLLQANEDARDAEDELATAQASLIEAETVAIDTTRTLFETQRALARSDLALAEVEQELNTATLNLQDSQAAAESASNALSRVRDQLDASDATVSAYEVETANFLAMAMTMGAGLDEADGRCVAEQMVRSEGPAVLTFFADFGVNVEDMPMSAVVPLLEAMDACEISVFDMP